MLEIKSLVVMEQSDQDIFMPLSSIMLFSTLQIYYQLLFKNLLVMQEELDVKM
jgi:hypothetical protein